MCCCNVSNGSIGEDVWVYGNMFTSPTEYSNPFLKGRFRVKMRGIESMTRGSEWDYLETGGFKILIPGWQTSSDVKIVIEYY